MLASAALALLGSGSVTQAQQNEPASTLVYTNAFEAAVGTEWSRSDRSVTPAGQRGFLGPFGNESVTLAVDQLPEHTEIHIEFDLFILRTWDGDVQWADSGPDVWGCSLADGPDLLRSSFSA